MAVEHEHYIAKLKAENEISNENYQSKNEELSKENQQFCEKINFYENEISQWKAKYGKILIKK